MPSGSISPPLFAVMAVTALLNSSRQSLVAAQTDCTNVNCPQNTTCVDEPGDFASVLPHGVDSLPFLDPTANWHCEDCPQNFTGLLCDVPIDTCDNGAKGGKAKHCYNGGKCVAVGNGTDVKYHCDCSDAVTEDKKSYAGLYCEHAQTTTCQGTQEEDDRWLFCVNGRDCKEDIDNFLRHPCKCGSEFEGPHCEYKTGTKPPCDLECFNGGRCNIGVKNYDAALDAFHLPYTEERHMDFQHCICKDDFTGLQCDIQKIACGEHYCYNGGTCYNTTQNGHYNYHCDCNPANTDEFSFAGRFCEHKWTNFCTKEPDQNGHLFCTNKGDCNVDNPHEGCACPEGFKGPSCEYPDGTEEECDHLQCANGGKCRKGIKDNGTLKQHADAIAFLNETNDNFEHCVCPDGYTGLKCEHQVEMCGDDAEHICLHGSKCVSGGDGIYTCNCDPASNETKQFAGHFCEHDSNDVCTKSGKASGDSSQAFCVNGGTCEDEVEDGEHHPGCKCNEGFFGDHCEYQEGVNPLGLASSSSSGDENSGGNGKGAFVAALVISLFAVFGLVLAVLFTRRRNQREAASLESSSPPGKNLAPLGAIFEEIDLNDEKVKGFNPTAYVNRVSDTPDII